ncbi:MFS transporter [Demequina sp.]|uniref:MFS transporter n=1 Tax=Demequina sp. TaxID=2050685 RepID=UPI003A86CCE2
MRDSAATAELERPAIDPSDAPTDDLALDVVEAFPDGTETLDAATTAVLPVIEVPPVVVVPPGADIPGLVDESVALAPEVVADVIDEIDATTLAIPAATAAQPVVLDEAEAATRSIESLLLSPRRAKLALTVLSVCAFAFGVNEASVVAMSAAIAEGLDVPVASIGVLATAFAITVVIATIPLAHLTQRWSRRTALTGAAATWTAGVAVAASASALPMLVTGRVISAGAHALFWAIVAPTAASLFAPHLRARTVTSIMIGASAAGVLGTPTVTFLSGAVTWQAPYWILAGLGVMLTVATALTLPAVRAHGSSSGVRGDLPSGPAFARVLAVAFLVTVGMTVTWTYVVPFYTRVAGLPSSMVPLLFALGGTLAVATTLAVGRFLARHAVRTVAVGTALLVGSWSLYALGLGWSAIAGQALQSVGWAIIAAGLLNWAMRHSPWRTEMGVGVYTVTMNAGAAIGPMLGAAIVAQFGIAFLPLVSIALNVVAAIVIATVPRPTVRKLAVPRATRMRAAARKARTPRRVAPPLPARRVKALDPESLRQQRAEWERRIEHNAQRRARSRAAARARKARVPSARLGVDSPGPASGSQAARDAKAARRAKSSGQRRPQDPRQRKRGTGPSSGT